MKINIIRGQKTVQQLPCFAYNHIFTREQQKVGQFHIYFETTGREGKRASERGRIVCLPLIRADEQLSRENERKAASTRAPPCQANKMSRKRWQKKEERRHRSTYLACHFLLGKKQNCCWKFASRQKRHISIPLEQPMNGRGITLSLWII
jgi:hypothetical protein